MIHASEKVLIKQINFCLGKLINDQAKELDGEKIQLITIWLIFLNKIH